MPARRRKRNPYYDGPPSDHFDGERFFVPGHDTTRTLGDLLKWYFQGGRKPWPARLDHQPCPAPPRRVEGAGLCVTLIGHATCLIQTGGLNILTDPFFSERASPLAWLGPKRAAAPGIALADLPPVDVVLLSHNHYDHMDLRTLRLLHDLHRPTIVTPLGNRTILEKARRPLEVIERDWGDGVDFGGGLTIHLAPALHWSRRTPFDRNQALWASFIIESAAGIIYFAADTGYGDGEHFHAVRHRFGPPRLALLPVGAYEPRWFMKPQHMNPAEAVAAHLALGAVSSLAIHHGTIQLTDEGLLEPVTGLAAALSARNVPAAEFRAVGCGQCWHLDCLAAPEAVVLDRAAE